MALKATVNKAHIQVSDMDRHYYETLSMTVAQHPSETDKRMMVRLLAYVLNANEDLTFTKGLSEDSEPEIWQKDYSEQILLWIDLGEVDEKRIKKACSSAQQVKIYTYRSSTDTWWQKIENKLHGYDNLQVIAFDPDQCEQMASYVARSMDLTCTIDTGQIWLSNAENSMQVTTTFLKQ
ncbi:YaeQ family protein [Thalassotalea sp. HSM 43]|uniref:YaeQ family protein n=1 Tax=Thalassotalea sp. HSM 43 TaxID=2552945 RepID=UPI0010802539|nr:YaeQ family protein [Thalassotalea sp. HSM 43]QBY05702.1 YaeQ family protein [Thalassotalea sp. HSM 43]